MKFSFWTSTSSRIVYRAKHIVKRAKRVKQGEARYTILERVEVKKLNFTRDYWSHSELYILLNKEPLFNCTPHFSRVFCTVKKIHNKIHYCKNFIFDRFWTFLDILAKIRKKSENPEFVFSTQWKKCFFYSVEKMFFTLSRKNRLFFNLSRKNRVFYKWDKLKNKLSTLSKCGLQSNKASC